MEELQGQDSRSRVDLVGHELVDVERDASEDSVRVVQGEIGVREDNNEDDLGGSVSQDVAIPLQLLTVVRVHSLLQHTL